jgi:hypothetical protein
VNPEQHAVNALFSRLLLFLHEQNDAYRDELDNRWISLGDRIRVSRLQVVGDWPGGLGSRGISAHR